MSTGQILLQVAPTAGLHDHDTCQIVLQDVDDALNEELDGALFKSIIADALDDPRWPGGIALSGNYFEGRGERADRLRAVNDVLIGFVRYAGTKDGAPLDSDAVAPSRLLRDMLAAWYPWRVRSVGKDEHVPQERTELKTATLPSISSFVELAIRSIPAEFARVALKAECGIMDQLRVIENAQRELRLPVRRMIELVLRQFEADPQSKGNFTSPEAGREFASTLQRLVSAAGERLCCPKCGLPGTFSCRKTRSNTSAFEFKHPQDGRVSTCGGWAEVPKLALRDSR